jgi:hypothetical protein
MNKFLRISLFSLLAMLSCGLYAQTATFDFTGDEAYGMPLLSGSTQEYNQDPYNCSEGNVTLTLAGRTRWWAGSPNHLRTYSGSTVTVSVPDNYIITSIVFTSTNNTAKNLSTTVGTYDNGGTWTGTANSVDFACSETSRFSTIEVTYQDATEPVKKNPGLVFSETDVTATIGEPFTAPTLTKETTAEVTYSSDNEEVATVDAQTGEVTIVALGTAKITAQAAENDEYAAGSASYTITVKNPVLAEVTLPYTETFKDDQGSFVIEDVNLSGLTYVWKHDNYGYMKASAYAGSNKAAESWLISPTIDMTNIEKSTLTFEQCINKYFGNVEEEATLWVKEDGGEWNQITLTYPTLPEDGNWSDFETQTVDLTSYAGKKIKIGFKYTSTEAAAGTWEVRNVSITGLATGINKVEADTENVNAPAYNLAGQRVNNSYKGIIIKNGKKYINNK